LPTIFSENQHLVERGGVKAPQPRCIAAVSVSRPDRLLSPHRPLRFAPADEPQLRRSNDERNNGDTGHRRGGIAARHLHYPAFVLLAGNASLAVLVAMVCWLGLLKSFYSGALPSLMAKVFPTATRVSGMSLSYNVGVAVFGGFAPSIAQTLIDVTGSKLAPSYYMIATALLSLAAVIMLRRRYRM
jgi:hypothetical protein